MSDAKVYNKITSNQKTIIMKSQKPRNELKIRINKSINAIRWRCHNLEDHLTFGLCANKYLSENYFSKVQDWLTLAKTPIHELYYNKARGEESINICELIKISAAIIYDLELEDDMTGICMGLLRGQRMEIDKVEEAIAGGLLDRLDNYVNESEFISEKIGSWTKFRLMAEPGQYDEEIKLANDIVTALKIHIKSIKGCSQELDNYLENPFEIDIETGNNENPDITYTDSKERTSSNEENSEMVQKLKRRRRNNKRTIKEKKIGETLSKRAQSDNKPQEKDSQDYQTFKTRNKYCVTKLRTDKVDYNEVKQSKQGNLLKDSEWRGSWMADWGYIEYKNKFHVKEVKKKRRIETT
ncbi:hypothetical protein SteCoe_39531 [Stentor coeruleus]|uniref:Uncharacterized protein n=1 Tax=Stentor coeruleus TaxID=5963 RepID=A0A1R2AKK4_9CILI|nr:hypothetical protein SteCoe_39531 [Stentor coeruleus]